MSATERSATPLYTAPLMPGRYNLKRLLKFIGLKNVKKQILLNNYHESLKLLITFITSIQPTKSEVFCLMWESR